MIGVFGKMAKKLFHRKSYKLMILYRNVMYHIKYIESYFECYAFPDNIFTEMIINYMFSNLNDHKLISNLKITLNTC